MIRQLDQLKHWLSSLEQRPLLFEHQPSEADPPLGDRPESEDLQAQG